VSPGDRARAPSYAFASRVEEAEARADRGRNRDPALRRGPCGRLAGQARGPTPGLSASVGDKVLAFLELRGAPGRRNPASAITFLRVG
jgi:hypothetical protein